MTQHVESKIKQIIVNDLELDLKGKSLTNETPLLDEGLNLDSVNVLELISLIEEEFGVTIRDEDMSAELIGTIGSLAAYVRKELEAPPPDLPASSPTS